MFAAVTKANATVQFYHQRAPAALLGSLTPGVGNQDLTHRSGGDGEEVRAVLPVWISLVGQAQISLVDQCRSLQCVIGTLPVHLTMSDAPEFVINQRSQFREGSIVPLTPSREEVGHSLLRDRRRIHNRSSQAISPKNLCTPKAFPKKILIQMITLIALFRLCQ